MNEEQKKEIEVLLSNITIQMSEISGAMDEIRNSKDRIKEILSGEVEEF